MSLTISDETLQVAQITPDELRIEIAVLLYTRERLTIDQAARLAEMSREQFQRCLAAQDLSSYGIDDYTKDIETLKKQ